jgi:hypothetical protein
MTLDDLATNLGDALDLSAEKRTGARNMESGSRRLVPVKSGALRGTITSSVTRGGIRLQAGTSRVDYSQAVETREKYLETSAIREASDMAQRIANNIAKAVTRG